MADAHLKSKGGINPNVSKGKNQITVHKTAADMVRRDEANKKLAFAAGNKIKPVLKQLDTALTGLGDKAVISHRIAFGRNKVTHEKKKSLVARLAGAFINPFTAILFCLAVVSILPILLYRSFSMHRRMWLRLPSL